MKAKKVSKPIKVMVAVLNQGDINVRLATQLINMIAESMVNKKYIIDLRFSSVTCVDYNRNTITQMFLESDNKFLLMFDDDNPCLKNPLDLVEKNKDIIICPTFTFRAKKDHEPALNYNVYKKEKVGRGIVWRSQRMTPGKPFMQYDAGGTGCILIKRRVLEKLKAPFLSNLYKDKGVRKYGMDLWFCERAKKAGFQVWAHWEYACHHYKVTDLLDVATLMLKEKYNVTDKLVKVKEKK